MEHSRVWKRLKGGEAMLEPRAAHQPTLLEVQLQANGEAIDGTGSHQSQTARRLRLSRTKRIGRRKRPGNIH